jgi:nitrate reductase / nitrite oxidoreductase, beta subunit
MARVYNWQIGRDMSYWYPESRPKKQFAAVFDINKCIACQSCTLACKTTWTSGKGQEYQLWNNVESKPYGFYPLAWDLKLLDMLGAQQWQGDQYTGQTIFEAAEAGERVLGWRPEERDYAYPNVGEDDCAGKIETGRRFPHPAPGVVLLPGSDLQPLHLPRLFGLLPARFDLQAARGRHRAGRPEPLPRLPRMRQSLPVQEGVPQPAGRHVGEVHRLFPQGGKGLQPQCFVNCIGKIRMAGSISRPEDANPENPIDYLVHIRKVALPLFPQLGSGSQRVLHPADPRADIVPAPDVRARRRGGDQDVPSGGRRFGSGRVDGAVRFVRTDHAPLETRRRLDDRTGRTRSGDRPRAVERTGLPARPVRREVSGRANQLSVVPTGLSGTSIHMETRSEKERLYTNGVGSRFRATTSTWKPLLPKTTPDPFIRLHKEPVRWPINHGT